MWKDKPAVVAALSICAGILIANLFRFDWYYWCIPTSITFIFSLITIIKFRNNNGRELIFSLSISLLLLFSAGLNFSTQTQLQTNNHIKNYLSQSYKIYCEIVDEPRLSNNRTTTLVKVHSLVTQSDSIIVEGKSSLTIFADKRKKENAREFHYGEILCVDGKLEEPSTSRNPGEFSYKDYLTLNGIYATINIFGYTNIKVIEKGNPNWFFENIIFPSKHFITKTIYTVMSGDEANFLVGLLLGDRTDISSEIKKAFTNTGTIHVLAVSGSHIALVVVVIYVLLGILRIPQKPKILLTIVGIIYYMFLTGATPPIVRSSLMGIVVLLAKYFQYRMSVYNALGLSGVILLAFDPVQLLDVGFQLSFSAVFSMVYFYPKIETVLYKIPEKIRMFKIWKFTIINPLLQLFGVSLAAQVGTLPFTAYYFGQVSIISLLANLIIVPLVEIIVTIGLTSAILGIISLYISSCFNEVNNLIAMFTLWSVQRVSEVPYAVVSTATFGMKETIFYSGFVLALFNLNNAKIVRRTFLVIFACVTFFLILSLFSSTEQKKLRVTFLDVGQGDAAFIQFPSGENILIDAGPKTFKYDAGEKVVAPFLRKNGISIIDAIIISHPHSDHLGGVPFLLKEFQVKSVIDPNQRASSSLYNEYEQLAQQTEFLHATAGNIFSKIPNVRWYELHPAEQFLDTDSSDGYSDLNDASVVFKLQYGETSFLFTGDAEISAEEHIVEIYTDFLQSDVIKAGHHGSITSSCEEFLKYVKPKEVVVSVGKFNKFRHPSAEVLERYKNLGTHIHRTDEEGAIIFESDGKEIHHVKWR